MTEVLLMSRLKSYELSPEYEADKNLCQAIKLYKSSLTILEGRWRHCTKSVRELQCSIWYETRSKIVPALTDILSEDCIFHTSLHPIQLR